MEELLALDKKESLPSKEQENLRQTHIGKNIKLGQWKEGTNAPIVMARGAAAVKGNVAYFMSLNGEICSYDTLSDVWSVFPKCPHEYSSLAVVSGHITAIGGIFKYEPKVDTFICQTTNNQSKKEEAVRAISGSANPDQPKKEENMVVTAIGGSTNPAQPKIDKCILVLNSDTSLKEKAENRFSMEKDGVDKEQTESELYTHIDETSDEETENTVTDGSTKEQAEDKTPEGTDGKTKENMTIGEKAIQVAKSKPTEAVGGDDARSQPKNSEKPMRRNIVEEEVDTLLSIENDKEQNLVQWKEHFPPMPTKRQGTATVSTNDYLIVAGGKKELTCLITVEVMNIKTRIWSTSKAARLPHPYFNASATICGNELYVLGGNDENGYTKSVMTCSLQMLIESCRKTLTDSKSVWKGIKDAPVYYSTCVTVNLEHGQVLLAVGGVDESLRGLTTSAVYNYNQNNDSWEFINNTSTQRYHPLVVVLANNKLITVGGKQIPPSYVVNFIKNVEIADICY